LILFFENDFILFIKLHSCYLIKKTQTEAVICSQAIMREVGGREFVIKMHI